MGTDLDPNICNLSVYAEEVPEELRRQLWANVGSGFRFSIETTVSGRRNYQRHASHFSSPWICTETSPKKYKS